VKCDLCAQREATVYLTEVIDNETRELHLCEPCAREKGKETAEQFGLAGLLAGLADFGLKLEGEAKKALACPRCKMSYDDFRKLGRLGCGSCYEAFHRYLGPLLKRIHGSTQHVGKIPVQGRPKPQAAQEELARLKEGLTQAIASEAFEEAARLRDRIHAIESRAKCAPLKKNGS
jgi:protein arginine kinase activator